LEPHRQEFRLQAGRVSRFGSGLVKGSNKTGFLRKCPLRT
jgi:hypothetical protein